MGVSGAEVGCLRVDLQWKEPINHKSFMDSSLSLNRDM